MRHITDYVTERKIAAKAGEMHKFPDEKPEPMRLVVVTDKKGNHAGHLSCKVVYDGERFFADLGNYCHADLDNIESWVYLEDI